MAEYVIVGFTLVAIASAGAARLWRHHIRKDSEINQIIPLPESVNEINIIRKSKKAWIIKNTKGRKIYALVKSDSTWHLQTAYGQTLSTIKNDLRDKYIVMHRSPYLFNGDQNSPLATTPSVIKMDLPNWILPYQKTRKSIFQFGSTLKLQWIGPDHFEILTNAPKNTKDHGITFHERVATLKSFDKVGGYSILFDYNKINVEILISTFFLALLARTFGYP